MIGVTERVIALDASAPADRELIGNKGRSIVRMTGLGLPVPPAFALPIDECRRFHAAGERIEDELWSAVLGGLSALEERSERHFGDPADPLLVSVRSGAAVSMPGMMDTILNLGMTDEVEEGLARLSGDPGFARATHVRFVHEFGHTVLGADLDEPGEDADAASVRAAVLGDTGEEVPVDPREQLHAAIRAVFGSWSSRRAKAYRRHWGMSDDGGTAVIVQAMVFGNLGGESGTGVLFTRNPLDGAREPYGEWLPGGQGEDVVSGTHDPLPLEALREQLSEAHDRLIESALLLERENGDVQDVEFTIERGTLYLLQTRSAKRSPNAAVRMAVELADEGAIDRAEALRRVSPEQVAGVLAPRLPESVKADAEVLARGTPACPGVASGVAVADSDAAERAGSDSVLVRPTTSPEDIAGMIAACAVVTEKGGSTSHAAVVTRALGRPSVVGSGEGVADSLAGREITVDGTQGLVYAGRLPTENATTAEVPGLDRLLEWAREASPVEVVDDAPDAVDLDEAGLGLDEGGGADAAALGDALEGARAARGAVLATEAGARALLDAGLEKLVRQAGQHEAALLLRIVQALPRTENEEEKGP